MYVQWALLVLSALSALFSAITALRKPPSTVDMDNSDAVPDNPVEDSGSIISTPSIRSDDLTDPVGNDSDVAEGGTPKLPVVTGGTTGGNNGGSTDGGTAEGGPTNGGDIVFGGPDEAGGSKSSLWALLGVGGALLFFITRKGDEDDAVTDDFLTEEDYY